MIFIVKVLLIVIGLKLILKDVIEETFDNIFLGIIILIIGIGLEMI